MSKRVWAVAAAVAAVLVVAAGVPAGAQTYPPPPASLTVDDATPAPGQAVIVTMSGCGPGTFALFGVDLILLGSARAGADGVVQASVSIPTALPAGPHTLSGYCIGANGLPLFLRTAITVTPPGPPPPTTTAAAPGGTGTGESGGAGGGGTGAGSSAPGGSPGARRVGRSGPRGPVPSPDALAAPTLPADAPVLFEDAAEANGVPPAGRGRTPPRSGGAQGGEPAATATAAATGSSDVGPFSTLARVGLGLAAIFGVPVALAFSRRPRRAAPHPA
jgi:hypothetical protein